MTIRLPQFIGLYVEKETSARYRLDVWHRFMGKLQNDENRWMILTGNSFYFIDQIIHFFCVPLTLNNYTFSISAGLIYVR